MYKPELVLKSKMHKILLDFEKHVNHQILARRLDLVLIHKKKKNKTGLDVYLIFLFWRITEWNWKKVKR